MEVEKQAKMPEIEAANAKTKAKEVALASMMTGVEIMKVDLNTVSPRKRSWFEKMQDDMLKLFRQYRNAPNEFEVKKTFPTALQEREVSSAASPPTLCTPPHPHPSAAAPQSLCSPPCPRPSTATPRSLRSAVPVLALPSPNLDEIDRICRISHDIQPQLLVGHAGRTNKLLVGHAGSTDELLVGIRPTAPLKTAPSPLDSACVLLAAWVQTATTSRRQAYCAKKRYRGMKQARRCARRPATALIVALTEHRGRLDRVCRLSVDSWLCAREMNPSSSPLSLLGMNPASVLVMALSIYFLHWL
nr:uncharacterized protein LOC109785622 [Aegilops tauschii subsp. strangulata]